MLEELTKCPVCNAKQNATKDNFRVTCYWCGILVTLEPETVDTNPQSNCQAVGREE